MSTPIVTQLPPDVFDTTLLSKLPRARDRDALLELSPVICEIISQAPKASEHPCFVNRSKKLLTNGRPYKIHTFFHPASNRTNIYVFFSKHAGDEITARTSLKIPPTTKLDLNRTYTELACANKIFHTSYQISCIGKKVVGIHPVAKLSGNFKASVNDRSYHREKVDILERELNFLREFIGVPDICQLLDGTRYMGTHKFQDAPAKENVEKVVMYQELYSTDLCDVLLNELATMSKQDRLILVAPLLYRLLRGAVAINAAGIAHQDFKIENIFLSILYKLGPNNVYSPVIGDFGRARRIDDFYQSRLGTLGYFAPELYDMPQDDGNRIDIWNLGYIFYQLLNGTLPEWITLIDCADACQRTLTKIHHHKGSKKSSHAIQKPLDSEKYSPGGFKKLQEVQTQLRELEARHLDGINQYLHKISDEMTAMVNEVVNLDASLLVCLNLPEKHSPSKESEFLVKLSSYLENFTKFIDLAFESLTQEQMSTVGVVIAKLNTALVQKRQAIWETLNRVPCPFKHAPQTLEEAVTFLVWNMLKPKPKERISQGEALDVLSQFTNEHRALFPLKKA